MQGVWLKYTLHVAADLEEAFVEAVLVSPYTLGWMEPQIEVLVTDNGYDYEEKPDLPVIAYLFEPMNESQEQHVNRLHTFLQQWKGEVSLQTVEQVEEEHESWKQEFQPVQVGEWVIAPTWIDEVGLEGDKQVLRIDPGAAFGTGYHGTTQDILLFLQGMDLKGRTVLDIGAGSGILSIFAAKEGALQPVYAVDINEQSAYQVRANLANNGLDDSAVEVVIGDAAQPDIRSHLPEKADLILVNIGGDEDIAMLPLVKERIQPGGTVVLSGMVEWNRDKVLAAYEEAGFAPVEQKQSEEWVTVLLRAREKME